MTQNYPPTSSLILQKLQFADQLSIPKQVLANMTIEQAEDFLTRAITYRIRGYVLGAKVQEVVEERVRVPLTWWDSFKQAYFPAWLLRRFPAQTRGISTVVKHYHMCPHLNIETRERHFEFLTPLGASQIPITPSKQESP